MRLIYLLSITSFSRILGTLFYFVFSKVNTRFLFPLFFSNYIEFVRTLSLALRGASIGKGSLVRSNVFIAYPKNLRLGQRVKIGDYSRIYNFSDFIVGDDTEIGPGLHVQTNEHDWFTLDLPLAKQGSHSSSVEVGSNSYLGANVTLLSGVTIGSSVVVAAGAVVTRDLDCRALYGGVPAKKIRDL